MHSRAQQNIVIPTEVIRFAFSTSLIATNHIRKRYISWNCANWTRARTYTYANFHRESVALAIERELYYPYPGRKRAVDYRNQKRVVKVIKQFVTKLRRSPPLRSLPTPDIHEHSAYRVSCYLHSKIMPRKDKNLRVITPR